MAVLQMHRISICALKKDRKAILEKLQALGIMQVDVSMLQDEDLHKMDTAKSRQVFEKQAVAADQALEVLDRYAPEKKSMLSSLEGKPLIGKPSCQYFLHTGRVGSRTEKSAFRERIDSGCRGNEWWRAFLSVV